MKKTLLLISLGFFATLPMMAQEEEEMTQYIINASFDDDLTFEIDGKMKEAISTENSLSDRSWAYIAADSTLYARPKSTSSQNRPDGRKLEAVNGFIGRIKGWTVESSAKFPGCEWVYFGNVPYGLGAEAVPTSDDTNGFLYMPGVPEEFGDESNVAAAYMRAGWGGWVLYKQEVKLPCAEYRLEYWTKNCNASSSANPTNLTKVICRRDVFQEEEGSMSATDWTRHEFCFTPVDKFTLQFGFQSANSSSNANPWVLIDGIKLTKIGDADPAELLKSDIYYYVDEQLAYLPDSLMGVEGEYFAGLIEECEQKQKDYLYDGNDVEKLQESLNKLKELYETTLAAGKNAQRLEALYLKVMNVLDATDYPGKPDLAAYCEDIYKLLYSEGTVETIAAAEQGLKDALNTYYFSQAADMENPANYSFLVQSPWFCAEGREPADNSMEAVAVAELVDGDQDATGWVNGTTASATTGAWFKVGRTCYQLWATNFSGYLDVHQDLTGLPNGIYSVSCDMVTNADALSDQHVYASSTLGQTEGYMTDMGVLYEWPNGDYTGGYPLEGEDPWETVTTEQTVIVIDGKLTIGARSTHNGRVEEGAEDISVDQRRGCFWLTNFVLRYHGAATQEQINAAITARLQKAQDLAAAMHFAADKKQVNDSIAAYNANNDLAVLNNGIALAETSEAKYNEIMEEGKTLPTVAENLENDPQGIYGVSLELVKYANDATLAWLASAEATYQKVDSCLNLMKAYINTYGQAAIDATIAADEFRAASRQAVASVIAAHTKQMMVGNNQFLTTAEVDALVAELNQILQVAVNQDVYEKNPNGTDYTGWIINPDFAAITGWEVEQGTGNGPLNQGQYYTGDGDHKYFDSYNSAVGELNIYGQQVVQGLPNGTYTARVAARTSAPGAFVFAATGETKADTLFKEIPMETYTYLDPVTEKDTTVNATDIYGSMWEQAFEKYINGEADELESAIATCNGQNGRGWKWMTIEGIVVTDHQMTIGQTTDGARTGKPFEGTWFSVVDWSLTLTAKGDNTGWNGPLTGINNLAAVKTTSADGVYTIDGRRANKVGRGFYIVVRDGKASKVLVK